MKDMWDKEAKVGDIFVHPLRAGSSLWVHKYEIVSIDESAEIIRAKKIKDEREYKVFVYKSDPGRSTGYYRNMTDAERAKVDAKTVVIRTFSDRSTIL
jgi:hypothetical protein